MSNAAELEEANADGGVVVDEGLLRAGADQTLLGAEKDGVMNEYIGMVERKERK
jgi:hypothetical protein